VTLPYVRRWATLADPLAEAAQLLAEPPSQLPRPLRAYAAALRELVEVVTAAGRLDVTPDERHARPPDSDERHSSRSASGERRVSHVGPAPLNPRRVGPGGRDGCHDERAVPRRNGARVLRPDPTPVARAAPQRPRGVRIVWPDGRVERVG
jgi:hypothetical protein